MSTDNRAGKKIPGRFTAGSAPGIKVDAGPYLAIVKNVVDPTRSGRLSVFIPDFGGLEDQPQHWTTVAYASPFAGHTRSRGSGTDKNREDKFTSTEQTYGFWMVPPDIGNTVLVTFANGNPDRGFWFACVLDTLQHYMIPNIPGSGERNNIGDTGVDVLKRQISAIGDKTNLPVTELNSYNPDNLYKWTGPQRPLHSYQSAIYIEQGLDRNTVLGPTKGSSQRETPSGIFGISTPGRPFEVDPKQDPTLLQKPDQLAQSVIYERQGGHVFYMDDGDLVGAGQQIRLRSANGNQLVMDDQTGVISIHNGSGSVWLELAQSGQLHVFAAAGINIRSKGNFNIHSDANINMFAAKEIRIKGETSVRIEGQNFGISALQLKISGQQKIDIKSKDGALTIDAKAGFNAISGGAIKFATGEGGGRPLYVNKGTPPDVVKPPKGISTYKHSDTLWNKGNLYWQVKENAIRRSICNIVPTHEPWDRTSGVPEFKAGNDAGLEPPTQVNIPDPPKPEASSDELRDGTGGTGSPGNPANLTPTGDRHPGLGYDIAEAAGDPPNTKRVTDGFLQYFTGQGRQIGSATAEDIAAYLAVVAQNEGNFEEGKPGIPYWKNVSNPSYIGAFQMGQAALITVGMLTDPGTDAGKRAFLDPGVAGATATSGAQIWNGPLAKEYGISSMNDFLNNPAAQTAAVLRLAEMNYNQAVRGSSITVDGNRISLPPVLDYNSPPDQVMGYLMGAHLIGGGGAMSFVNYGNETKIKSSDANNTSFITYYNLARDAYNRSHALSGG